VTDRVIADHGDYRSDRGTEIPLSRVGFRLPDRPEFRGISIPGAVQAAIVELISEWSRAFHRRTRAAWIIVESCLPQKSLRQAPRGFPPLVGYAGQFYCSHFRRSFHLGALS